MSEVLRDPTVATIADFLVRIGLAVRFDPVPGQTILPGIQIDCGSLVIDESRLRHPGDLLHEAGHLAVVAPGARAAIDLDIGDDGGAEMAAIAWSYAAALHLDLDPAVVFHVNGYRGGSHSILENFKEGRYVGVPLLQWMRMTADAQLARTLGVPPYPHMLRWLRDERG